MGEKQNTSPPVFTPEIDLIDGCSALLVMLGREQSPCVCVEEEGYKGGPLCLLAGGGRRMDEEHFQRERKDPWCGALYNIPFDTVPASRKKNVIISQVLVHKLSAQVALKVAFLCVCSQLLYWLTVGKRTSSKFSLCSSYFTTQ